GISAPAPASRPSPPWSPAAGSSTRSGWPRIFRNPIRACSTCSPPSPPCCASAAHRALGDLYGMVQQQAALLSFVEVFWLLAAIFLLMSPLVLLMKRPTH